MNRKERRKYMKRSISQILKVLGISRSHLKKDLRKQGFDPTLMNQYLVLLEILKNAKKTELK